LKCPHDLPVVSLGTIVKRETGKREHVWVPAELCDIVIGLPRRGKLNDEETKSMINYACNPPGTNARDIVERGLPRLGFSVQNRSPILEQFGIQIENKMVSIPARVLLPPSSSPTKKWNETSFEHSVCFHVLFSLPFN
jgi:eukaryotic translation initiation factor 2C